ncbi:MAG TPA: NAD-dependent epimerase/dehydratase family protein [Solirubrobacteraceae bacterium]|nr:NAD-dependent epimerase/dehydratase family protein [Solirubrobacteraceae bacterium]
MTSAFVTGGSGFIGGALVGRLVGEGWAVRALSRSERSDERLRALGAEPVRGDLADPAAMAAGADGCDVAFHAAAHLGDWGSWADFERDNVEGTENALAACAKAGVRRFVHVGTEAALLAGEPLVAADERAPLRFDSAAPYAATKARAEAAVLAASRPGFQTVSIRPRFVWGAGDATLLPALAAMVRAGRFAWIGGGRQRTSHTHVDNAVEGLVLGATREGVAGRAFFVTDGAPTVFRELVSRLLATQGLAAPDRSIPLPLAKAAAAAGETAWRTLRLPGRPPLTRFAVWVAGLECTLDTTRARAELGYAPVRGVDEGMAGLAAPAGGGTVEGVATGA